MDESFDLTPPVSPVVPSFKLPSVHVLEEVPYFSCQGPSYLKSKNFSLFIDLDLKTPFECVTVISGKHFSTHSSLFYNLSWLFGDIKKNFFHVRALTIDNLDCASFGDPVTEIQRLRKNICSAFLFLLKCSQNFYLEYTSVPNFSFRLEEQDQKSDTLVKIMTEVKSLLFCVDRIINIPNIMHVKDFNDRSRVAEYFSHYFHMCLDIWWNCTALLKMISIFPLRVNKKEVFCSDLEHSEPWLQVLLLTLSDFITLGINQHEYFSSFSNLSPFICKCVQEFWVMSITILDKNMASNNDSFWAHYNRIVQNICKCENKSSEEITIHAFSLFSKKILGSNVTELCLWFTSHVATLYKYDKCGNYDDDKTPKGGNVVVKYLVNFILSSKETKEKNLYNALFYCVQLTSMWEPSCDIILPLTDFFIKNINETFQTKSGIDSLNFLHNNAFEWYEKIEKLTDMSVMSKYENSYDLYLKMLCILLQKSTDGTLWRSLKGRIYSKFMPKKFKEFSEIALQNSYTLFLIIVSASNEVIVKETIDKIYELSSVIEDLANPRKQMISWKALFVLMHIFQKRSCLEEKLTLIVKKIVAFFDAACLSYHKIQKDSANKNTIMNLLMIYIDNMSDLFDQNQELSFFKHELISENFSLLLSSCGITEQNYILNVFLNILMKFQNTLNCSLDNSMELQHVGFFKHFFTHVYPSVEKFSRSNNPPQLISDIAALLTSLAYRFSTSLDSNTHDYRVLFLNFVNEDDVNCLFVCRYLTFVLDDLEVKNGLKSRLNLDTMAFQSWLKCIVHLSTPCKDIDVLTRKVFSQEEILELFPEIKNFSFNNGNHAYVSIALFRIMGMHFEKCNTLQEKNNLKLKMQYYFKTFVSFVAERIKKQCNVPCENSKKQHLNHIYKLISHLVEYCSALLHVKFNPRSILPQLLDQTVFPQIILPKDKDSQSVISYIVKDYIPNFLRGLFKLNYTDDKCIEREIKNIIVTYLNLYSPSNNLIANFFVTEKPEILSFFLDILKINVLLGNQGNKKGFHVCFQLLKVVSIIQKKEVTEVLLKSAFEIYMKHTGSLSDDLFVLVKEVFTYIKEKFSVDDFKAFLMPIIGWFIQEKLLWSVARGFNMLNNLTDCIPELLPQIVPLLSKTVLESESRQGLGEDDRMRKLLQNFINKQKKNISLH